MAWIGAAFSLLVGLGMLAGHWGARMDDPLHSPQLRIYKEKLRDNPGDEPLSRFANWTSPCVSAISASYPTSLPAATC
jgi:hypothetical protein